MKWEFDRLPFGEVFFKKERMISMMESMPINTHMFFLRMFIGRCMTSCSWCNCWLMFFKSMMMIIFIHFIITWIPTNTKAFKNINKSMQRSLDFTLMLLEDFQLNVSFVVKHSRKKRCFDLNDIWRWNE